MANIASVLKDEILRLARKEVRKEIEGLRTASAKYRSEIAAIKRTVAELEKRSGRLEGKRTRDAVQAAPEEATKARFSAKGFASFREKRGLSASELGKLLGISAQTVYNWEAGKSRPTPKTLGILVAVRALGKREIQAKLAEQAGS